MENSSRVEFSLSLRCGPNASFEVVKILDEMRVDYRLGEKAALIPVYDGLLCEIIITIVSSALLDVLVTLFKKLWKSDVFVEYETRYEAALRFLKDKRPIVCQSREDREHFSEYVFKTRESRYRWTYDRGEVTFNKAER